MKELFGYSFLAFWVGVLEINQAQFLAVQTVFEGYGFNSEDKLLTFSQVIV